MLALPTALLRHVSREGEHFDWLLGDPADPAGPLLTFRVRRGSGVWDRTGAWDLEPIAAHRRVYLHYQGPLSRGRGRVCRVDEGSFTPLLWSAARRVMMLRMKQFDGRVELCRVSPRLWRAKVLVAAGRDDGDCEA